MRSLRLLVCAATLVALVSAGPIKHDQRQDGEVNVRADLENFVIVIVPTSKSSASSLLDLLRNAIPSMKSSKLKPGSKTNHRLGGDEDESTKHFIESKSAAPYHVDLTPTKDGLAKLHPDTQQKHRQQQIVSENGEILIAHSPVVSLKHLHGYRPRVARSVDVTEKSRAVETRGTAKQVQRTGGARVQMLDKRSVDIFADVSAENRLYSVEDGDDVAMHAPVDDAPPHEFESDESNLIVGSVEELDRNDVKKSDVDEVNTKEDELLLIGAEFEQCGPERRRNSEGICQSIDEIRKK